MRSRPLAMLVGVGAIGVVVAAIWLLFSLNESTDADDSTIAGAQASSSEAGAQRRGSAAAPTARAEHGAQERSSVPVPTSSPAGRAQEAGADPALARGENPAERARRELLAAVEGSGSATEPWSGQGASLLESFGRSAQPSSERGCFVAGCAGTFTFVSIADYEHRRAELEATSGYVAWTGGKRWSEPEALPDGHLIVSLVLYRPD